LGQVKTMIDVQMPYQGQQFIGDPEGLWGISDWEENCKVEALSERHRFLVVLDKEEE